MTKHESDLTNLDKLLYSIKSFHMNVYELYEKDKLIFTNNNYREISSFVNGICDCFNEQKCDYDDNYPSRNQSNNCIYELIAKSMEDIKEDLEEAIKDIEEEEKLATRPQRTVSLKFFDYWEKLLDKQNEYDNNNNNNGKDQSSLSENVTSSFVKRRVQQFDKDRRKSSTVYSLANIRNYNADEKYVSNVLVKSRSTNIINETDDNNAVTLNVTNNTSSSNKNSDTRDIYTFVTTYESERNLSNVEGNKPAVVGGLVSIYYK